MRILVVNADSIFVNTSANLCHLSYIDGMVQAGHRVDLLCADNRYKTVDTNMHLPAGVATYTYSGLSFYEWLSIMRGHSPADNVMPIQNTSAQTQKKAGIGNKIVDTVKSRIRALYGVHGIYSTFLRKAAKFHREEKYDYIISLSTPTASHLLAYQLLQKRRICAKHWIQIWEDPWYADAFGFNGKEEIFEEEKRLLSFAERICYVSPLTLRNQQRLFPESADKMFWMPLPAYYKAEKQKEAAPTKNIYGYFGAYYPAARDLAPFYEAARETGIETNICGDPSSLFTGTEQIHIYPRLSLAELKPIEDRTNVLVFVCNRKGGQIPGKIYQYSATAKTILFILDGTGEEQTALRDYFGKYNRYMFCRNSTEDIKRAIVQIESGNLGGVQNRPLDDFEPKKIITAIMEACEEA